MGSATETKHKEAFELVDLEVTRGTTHLLGPVSLSLTRGQCVILSGQLGSGKSLLCEYLAGFRRPGLHYSGERSFRDEAGDPASGTVALAPQDWRLGALRTDPVRSVLPGKPAEGPDWFTELEVDLDRVRNLGMSALSAGERMRLLLACSLAQSADLVVIDSPAEVLDPRQRGLLALVMEAAISRGKMLIVSGRDRAPWAPLSWRRMLIGTELGTEPVAVPLLQKRKDGAPAVPTPPALEVAALDVERHGRRFFGQQKPALAVDGATLFVRKGEILVLLGPSGSGKSTLLGAMAGLLPSRSGRIRVAGVEVGAGRGRPIDATRRRIQLVSAEGARALDPARTAGQHLELAIAKGSALGPLEWLDRLGLPARLAEVEADFLSEAEGFRLSLALSLCKDPRVVLLDTPRSGGLDADGGTMTGLLLAEKTQGRSFVLATSDPGISRSIADRIAILDAGRVIEFGPTSLILRQPAHPRTLSLLAAEAGPPHDPRSPKIGCHLAGHCPRQLDRCQAERPHLDFVPGATRNHRVACFNPNTEPTGPAPTEH